MSLEWSHRKRILVWISSSDVEMPSSVYTSNTVNSARSNSVFSFIELTLCDISWVSRWTPEHLIFWCHHCTDHYTIRSTLREKGRRRYANVVEYASNPGLDVTEVNTTVSHAMHLEKLYSVKLTNVDTIEWLVKCHNFRGWLLYANTAFWRALFTEMSLIYFRGSWL